MNPNKSSLFLDSLRILAAWAVTFTHVVGMSGGYAVEEGHPVYHLGNFSVVIFYILSGYLIAGAVKRQSENVEFGFSKFFSARFFRIYSAFIPALIFVLLIRFSEYFFFNMEMQDVGSKTFIGNFFMLQEHPLTDWFNWSVFQWGNHGLLDIRCFGFDRPLWTLSVEWWLYMSFGWMMLANKKSWYFFPVLLFFISEPLHQVFIGTHMGAWTPLFWVAGALAAYRPTWFTVSNKRVLNLLLIILPLLAIYFYMYVHWQLAGVMVFLIIMLVMNSQSAVVATAIPVNKIVRLLASSSFTLYLIHFPLASFFISFNPEMNSAMLVIITTIICILVSLLWALPFEMQYRKWHKRWGQKVERLMGSR